LRQQLLNGLDEAPHRLAPVAQVPGFGIEALGSALEGLGYSQRDYFMFPNT
jgi:hypothetical protein